MTTQNKEHCHCCPGEQGPQGVPGQNGVQGIQGVPGLDGVQGPTGQIGPMGPQGVPGQTGAQGPQGLQGEQGVQGIPGDCVNCPCECKPDIEFCEVYSLVPQVLAPSLSADTMGGVVLFENVKVTTSNIDVSMAGTTGVVTINKAGWYNVGKEVCAALSDLPTPLPVWSFSLFQNGVIVPASTFLTMTLSPDQQANQLKAEVLLHCNVGDTILLANTSSAMLNITNDLVGTMVSQPTTAALLVQLYKAD
jgi:hypothetical protein